jgi:hypothetical protein
MLIIIFDVFEEHARQEEISQLGRAQGMQQ